MNFFSFFTKKQPPQSNVEEDNLKIIISLREQIALLEKRKDVIKMKQEDIKQLSTTDLTDRIKEQKFTECSKIDFKEFYRDGGGFEKLKTEDSFKIVDKFFLELFVRVTLLRRITYKKYWVIF